MESTFNPSSPLPPPAPAGVPAIATRSRGLALGALALAIAALVAALPVLWWRLTAGAGLSSGGVLTELAQVFGQGGTPAGPGWLVILRATAMLAGFLGLVLGLVALILKQPGRLVAVAWVLALAALAATSLGLTLMIVLGVILLGVVLLGMGIG